MLSSCVFQQETAFERVVDYYSNSGDELKTKAASYLQEHSQWHFGITRTLNKDFGLTYKDALKVNSLRGDSVFQVFFDSCGVKVMSDTPILDCDTISDQFLREN